MEKRLSLEKQDKACVSGNCIQGIGELCFPLPICFGELNIHSSALIFSHQCRAPWKGN